MTCECGDGAPLLFLVVTGSSSGGGVVGEVRSIHTSLSPAAGHFSGLLLFAWSADKVLYVAKIYTHTKDKGPAPYKSSGLFENSQ